MAPCNIKIMYYILLHALQPMYHDSCLDRQFLKYNITYMLGKVFQFGITNVPLPRTSASIVV